MNVFQKVTLECLRKNRTRTAVTIVGIALSTALSTAVTTSVASLQHYLLHDELNRSGSYHVSMDDVEDEIYQKLLSEEDVTQCVYLDPVGYAQIDSVNEYKPYLYIEGMSADFKDLVQLHLVEGSLPETASQIMLPVHLSENGGVSYEVGDTITLDVGQRKIDGFTLTQHNPYTPESELERGSVQEKFVAEQTVTYTVCGTYERPEFEDYQAPGYTCLTVDTDGKASAELFNIWYTLKNPAQVYKFMERTGIEGNVHTDLLMYMGISRFDGYIAFLYSITAILLGLIVFGSVSLIYNAFSISVSERTSQFGLLSSVGATRKQLRYMVRFEAVCVSAVGIPLGLLIGIAGIGVTFLCVGSKFGQLTATGTPMRLYPSWTALLGAVVLSFLTVLLSAWIPSRRAMKMTAVEAIRQSTDVRTSTRPIRTPHWINKLFGLPGMLGQKYYKRSKKKYRSTVLSLFMSVVLFISAASFTDTLSRSVGSAFGENSFDILYTDHQENAIDPERIAELTELFRSEPAVEQCASVIGSSSDGAFPASAVEPSALKAEYLFDRESTSEWQGCYLRMAFLDDAAFRAFLAEYGIAEDGYFDQAEPLAVCLDRISVFDYEREKFLDVNCIKSSTVEFRAKMVRKCPGYQLKNYEDNGNTIVFERDGHVVRRSGMEAYTSKTLRAGKVLHEVPYFIGNAGMITFVYPQSARSAVLAGTYQNQNVQQEVEYMMRATDHQAASLGIHTALLNAGYSTGDVYNYAAERENERNVILIIKVFSYGFIVLISLIAVANVFNSISTNVALRRKEFAMLRSIGMTGKGLQRMMHFECLLYGTTALAFGLPVSIGMSVLIWCSIKNGMDTGYRLPLGAMLIAVLSVFIVVFVTMLYAMSKIRRENPMDALKAQ